ncbi:MAG: cation transporter [Deltaproteobacteria bacterium]|nr:cation transporter [Deltaproteobacteria bacterium]
MGYECSITLIQDEAHSGERRRQRARLVAALAVTVAFCVVEFVGGILANSLALIADAGHMLADSGSLIICLAAATLAERRGGAKRTYGFYRVEILAALANGVILLFLAAQIFYGAVKRISTPAEVEGLTMLAVAAAGLVANITGMLLLGGHGRNLNVKGAVLHMLGDTLSSVAVIAGGALVYVYGWNVVDPVLGVVIAGVITWNAARLVRDAGHVLLEGVPKNMDLREIEAVLKGIPGVVAVHDLHVWTITSGLDALSAHLVCDRPDGGGRDEVLDRVNAVLREKFAITHATIQLESPGYRHPEETHAPRADAGDDHGH